MCPWVTCEHPLQIWLTFSVPSGIWGPGTCNLSTAHPKQGCHQVYPKLNGSSSCLEGGEAQRGIVAHPGHNHTGYGTAELLNTWRWPPHHHGALSSDLASSSYPWDLCLPYWIPAPTLLSSLCDRGCHRGNENLISHENKLSVSELPYCVQYVKSLCLDNPIPDHVLASLTDTPLNKRAAPACPHSWLLHK